MCDRSFQWPWWIVETIWGRFSAEFHRSGLNCVIAGRRWLVQRFLQKVCEDLSCLKCTAHRKDGELVQQKGEKTSSGLNLPRLELGVGKSLVITGGIHGSESRRRVSRSELRTASERHVARHGVAAAYPRHRPELECSSWAKGWKHWMRDLPAVSPKNYRSALCQGCFWAGEVLRRVGEEIVKPIGVVQGPSIELDIKENFNEDK